jgi:hypothetical protein
MALARVRDVARDYIQWISHSRDDPARWLFWGRRGEGNPGPFDLRKWHICRLTKEVIFARPAGISFR